MTTKVSTSMADIPTSGTAQATTSGTSKTFSGIPAGTQQIIISFEEMSFDSAFSLDVQLGDAGGIETSGYVSSGFTMTASATTAGSTTSSFLMRMGNAAFILSGQMVLTLIDSSTFTWASSHSCKTDTTAVIVGGGSKSLSAELTQLQLSVSTGNFDNGKVNILYQ